MSKEKKNEVAKKVDIETQITLSTVNDLTKLANDAIKNYNETHPIYNDITKRLLEVYSDEATLASLDNDELLKLLTFTSRNQLAPVQELTKLVTQLNSLHERLEGAREIDKLRAVVEELQEAKAKSEVSEAEYEDTKKAPDEVVIDAEVEDVEDVEDVEVDPTPPKEEIEETEPEKEEIEGPDPSSLGEDKEPEKEEIRGPVSIQDLLKRR